MNPLIHYTNCSFLTTKGISFSNVLAKGAARAKREDLYRIESQSNE